MSCDHKQKLEPSLYIALERQCFHLLKVQSLTKCIEVSPTNDFSRFKIKMLKWLWPNGFKYQYGNARTFLHKVKEMDTSVDLATIYDLEVGKSHLYI